jgi:raffinose/stachyose/melibiose transport system permease protein
MSVEVKRLHRGGMFFVLPALFVFAFFIIYPIIETFRLSFFDWRGMYPEIFVGIRNYVELITEDKVFGTALKNTFIWVGFSLVFLLGVGFFLALVLDSEIRGKNAYRTIIYAPATMAGVVIAAVWGWIFNADFGLLNNFLEAVGLESITHVWLGNPNTALYSVIAVHIWRWVGTNMVIYLAAMQTIPGDVLEASIVDGAGWWRRIWRIKFPFLIPTTGMLAVLSVIGSMREFELVFILTRGGPAHSSDTLAMHVYNQAFTIFRPGYGATVAVVLLVLTLALTIIQLRFYKKMAEY